MTGKTTPTDDEMFAQIAKNMRVMEQVLQSQGAQIKRLQYRVDRLERVEEARNP